LVQQFGDKGSRHDDPLVDIEAVFAKPGLMDQVGDRDALGQPARGEACYALVFAGTGRAVKCAGQAAPGQPQHMRDKPGGLLGGVVRSMAVMQARFAELRNRLAQQGAQALRFVGQGWF